MPTDVTSRSLPSAWIDRLFERFALMYGNQWLGKWQGMDIATVKVAWADDLGFASADQLRRALEHCKGHNPHPPSSPEFVGLCRSFAPAMDTRTLLPDYSKGEIDPRVRAAIAEWLSPDRKRDPKDWAREVLALDAQGKYHSLCGLTNARRALGLVH